VGVVAPAVLVKPVGRGHCRQVESSREGRHPSRCSSLEFRFEGGLPFQEMPRRTPARGKIMDAMTFPRANLRPQRGTTSVRHGTVMVVPSPVVVMENVPAVLDV
jgi:hypothetical protein